MRAPHAQESLARVEACLATLEGGRSATVEDGLVTEVREGAARSRYEYLPNGELASLVEPDGTRYEYRYGDDGRLLAVTRDGEAWARFAYEGDRLAEAARDDGRTAHAYDERGRLVRTLRGGASPLVYAYDALGRVAMARSDEETSRFTYGPDGRPTRIEQTAGGVMLAVELEMAADGRLGRIRFQPWGVELGYRWDARGRPEAVEWRGRTVAAFAYSDEERLSTCDGADGVREETWHDASDGKPVRRRLTRGGEALWERAYAYGPDRRLEAEGDRRYRYDESGRLSEAAEPGRTWRFSYDEMDELAPEEGMPPSRVEVDRAGRVTSVWRGGRERVLRYDDAGELIAVLDEGERIAQLSYDHKGRLLAKRTASGAERYLYGPDDALLAIANEDGSPRWIFLRLPTGLAGAVDFTRRPEGELVLFHGDGRGSVALAGGEGGELEGPHGFDPFGVPLASSGRFPLAFRDRLYHADVGLYAVGCRWYDPLLRRFLTEDSYTGAPDDERLVSPHVPASAQRMARAQILGAWLKQPRVRNRHAYCCNDPVNRHDPNGHWSFGGVILSLLGAIWTLPNTIFGLLVEITCLVGEVIRWLVYLFSWGKVSWEYPGIDAASSGQLNAFALVFTGGWLGSIPDLYGITFGNVFFVKRNLPAGIPQPKLYEHELRHTNQYGWFGPFFHLGLPLFGVYEWDVIFNGYYNAWTERDARQHGGI